MQYTVPDSTRKMRIFSTRLLLLRDDTLPMIFACSLASERSISLKGCASNAYAPSLASDQNGRDHVGGKGQDRRREAEEVGLVEGPRRCVCDVKYRDGREGYRRARI